MRLHRTATPSPRQLAGHECVDSDGILRAATSFRWRYRGHHSAQCNGLWPFFLPPSVPFGVTRRPSAPPEMQRICSAASWPGLPGGSALADDLGDALGTGRLPHERHEPHVDVHAFAEPIAPHWITASRAATILGRGRRSGLYSKMGGLWIIIRSKH
jgi:hypothetical protein